MGVVGLLGKSHLVDKDIYLGEKVMEKDLNLKSVKVDKTNNFKFFLHAVSGYALLCHLNVPQFSDQQDL